MTLARFIKRGTPKSQASQKADTVGIRPKQKVKHVSIGAENAKVKIGKVDSSESLTNILADHPSNRVGGIGRRKFK